MLQVLGGKLDKTFIYDFISNLLGFILIIFTQQVILLPYVSSSNQSIFGNFIIVFTIANVFSYVTGGALGSCFLVKYSEYNRCNLRGDFAYLALLTFVPLGMLVSLMLVMYEIINYFSVVLLLTFLLTAMRQFFSALIRLRNKNYILIIQGLLYLIGTILSIYVLKLPNTDFWLLLMPELLSSAIYFWFYKLFSKEILVSFTIKFHDTFKAFITFSCQTLMGNIVTYADRLLIVPLLGKDNLVILFSVTIVSKCMAILINPLRNVFMARLAHCENDERKLVTKKIRGTIIKLILPLFIFVLITSIVALYILYPSIFDNAYKFIPFVAIASSLSTGSGILTAIIMRFSCPKVSLYISLVKFIVFLISAFILSDKYLLWGFVLAIVFTEIIVFIANLTFITITIQEKTDNVSTFLR